MGDTSVGFSDLVKFDRDLSVELNGVFRNRTIKLCMFVNLFWEGGGVDDLNTGNRCLKSAVSFYV